MAHRLAWFYMEGEWPTGHINHIRDDNRWVNLREVSNQENHKNQSISINNKSGVIGVCWNKKARKWHAQIKVNYKAISLGCFSDIHNAIKARKDAEIKYGFHKNHGIKQQTKEEV